MPSSRFAVPSPLVAIAALALMLLPRPALASMDDRQRRCLTLIAFAEAANEGPLGMLAVMKVMRNRIAHVKFADDACAVALEARQFQPVRERPDLRRALLAPEQASLATVAGARTPRARLQLTQAWRLAAVVDVWPETDPTRGALYFVNPRLMDADKCPWFARLKRTAVIGRHVFMTEYAPREPHGPPALACATAGDDRTTGAATRRQTADAATSGR